VSDKDTCPLRVTLLNMIVAGEHVPHLDVCDECAAFVAAATEAVTAFTDRGDVERAVESRIDSAIAGAPSRHWGSIIVASPELRRSVVIRDLVRRAYALDGSNARLALDLTTAAVAVCDAMVASGQAPSMELRFGQAGRRRAHLLDPRRQRSVAAGVFDCSGAGPIKRRPSTSRR